MGLTLSITGMDRETEAAVIAAFKIANIETGDKWTLLEGDAGDHVVVDMDSLYGPMSWLRLHAAGRKVIGLTSLERSQTDYRLPYPINASDLSVLLSEIAAGQAAPRHREVPRGPDRRGDHPRQDQVWRQGEGRRRQGSPHLLPRLPLRPREIGSELIAR